MRRHLGKDSSASYGRARLQESTSQVAQISSPGCKIRCRSNFFLWNPVPSEPFPPPLHAWSIIIIVERVCMAPSGATLIHSEAYAHRPQVYFCLGAGGRRHNHCRHPGRRVPEGVQAVRGGGGAPTGHHSGLQAGRAAGSSPSQGPGCQHRGEG